MKKFLIITLLGIVAQKALAQYTESDVLSTLLSIDSSGSPAYVWSLLAENSNVTIEDRQYIQYRNFYWDYAKYWANPKIYRSELADTMLIRQEDGIVYRYDSSSKTELAILNYNLNIGEEFVRPEGKRLVVEDKKIEDDVTTLWLRDLETGKEDVWKSDRGSQTTGYLYENEIPERTVTHLLSYNLFYFLDWNTDEVVQFTFQPRMLQTYEEQQEIEPLTYYFEGDSLCIKGKYTLSGIPSLKDHVVRCIRNGQQVYLQYDKGKHDPKAGIYGYSYYEYDIKIGGFTPGVYQIDGAYSQGVTIECKGNVTGAEEIFNAQISDRNAVFDLSGRRLTREPVHGIYIKNGRIYLNW